MHIDCDTCEVRGLACGDCVVTFLLGSAPQAGSGPELDAEERAALRVLAASGLVPPLRLVPPARSVAVEAPERATDNSRQRKGHRMKSAG